MWSKHRLMNAFIRQKYARYPFGRFTAATADSNRTDVLAMSILPDQKPFNWWTQRFINNDSRRYFSDQPVEVLYHCLQNTTQTHPHTIFLTWIFQQQTKKNNFFSFCLHAWCEIEIPNRIPERLNSIWFACDNCDDAANIE